MNLGLLLAFASVLVFVIFYFYKNGSTPYYLLYVVYLLPVMDLKVVPFDYGGLTVFDFITLITLLLSYNVFFRKLNFLDGKVILFTLFLAVLLVSSLASEFAKRALFSLITVVTPFVFSRFLILEVLRNSEFVKEFFKGVKFTCYVAVGFILIQVLLGPDKFTFYDMLNQNVMAEGTIRYPGFFMDSQINGIFLAMISFFWLANFEKFGRITYRQLAFFSLVLVGVMLSGSRSAFLGFASGIVFLVIFQRGVLRFHVFRYLLLGGIFLFFAAGATNTFDRFKSIDNDYSFRMNIWEGAFDIFKAHPLLGIGMNNYKDYARLHAQDQSITLDNDEILYLDHPENGYLKFLVEWGAIAFGLLMIIILTPLIKMFDYYIKGYNVKMATLMTAPVIAWLASNMSVHTLSDSRMVILLASALALIILFTEKNIVTDEA